MKIGKGRMESGSSIAEFGPAVFLILVVILFPMISMMMMAVKYADCLYLFHMVARQAALEPILVLAPNPGTNPTSQSKYINPVDVSKITGNTSNTAKLISNWKAGGLGQFAGVVPSPAPSGGVSIEGIGLKASVDLTEGSPAGKIGTMPIFNEYLHVSMTVKCRPFLPVPFPVSVPGLNADVPFQFDDRTVIENIP